MCLDNGKKKATCKNTFEVKPDRPEWEEGSRVLQPQVQCLRV